MDLCGFMISQLNKISCRKCGAIACSDLYANPVREQWGVWRAKGIKPSYIRQLANRPIISFETAMRTPEGQKLLAETVHMLGLLHIGNTFSTCRRLKKLLGPLTQVGWPILKSCPTFPGFLVSVQATT